MCSKRVSIDNISAKRLVQIVAPLAILVSTVCAQKSTVSDKNAKSEKQVHVLKVDHQKLSEKPVQSSKKNETPPKQLKKNEKAPAVVVRTGNDVHKSIEEAVAEGLILDPAPFKNEGNLDLKSSKHSKFGEEIQKIIENPISHSSETSGSSCSDESNEKKRVVVHPSQCRIFETTNQVTEPMSSH
ncbi:hypothetical protein GCK72_009331 [Caenorhabditis remanei]|uniref:Uncharacterized protein n=1 Tax=Caenorhabditis remanei TaxID=31234 RepID=A0A6A5H1F8_CAERE|nr:hypothetical protein GCK72_009331 [Caenorhabditis remanei]KAF1761077.1 hypothetical protein GCK72_009331 [Caenorhabditis remanei]